VAAVEAHGEFVVDHIGTADSDDFRDLGIEYYRFVEEPADRA
jgi:hypothetical protein